MQRHELVQIVCCDPLELSSHGLDPQAMFREFLAPQVTISATRISPYALMLIRVGSRRS
jgi:hypothetical protein